MQRLDVMLGGQRRLTDVRPKVGRVYPKLANLDETACFRGNAWGRQTWHRVVWAQEAIVSRKLL